MDFQWAPRTTGLAQPTAGIRGTLVLEGLNSSSTVIYNAQRYTVFNIQIAAATHSNWLVTDPGTTNREDLVIVLQSVASTTNTVTSFIIIVIPILRTSGAVSSDPAYLANIGKATSTTSYTLESCFPDSIYARYSTCINGYSATYPTTQQVYILVNTSGLSVSTTTMASIIGTITLPRGPIELPTQFQHLGTGGKTSISTSDFNSFIQATKYLTNSQLAENIGDLGLRRADKGDQYKCIEFDPDTQMDAHGNINIDFKTGDIADNSVADILAERQAMIALVSPNSATAANRKKVGVYVGYTVIFCVIIFLGIVIAYFFGIDRKDWIDAGIGMFVLMMLFIGAVVSLVGYSKGQTTGLTSMFFIGIWVALSSLLVFIPWVIYNSIYKPGWLDTVVTPSSRAPIVSNPLLPGYVPPSSETSTSTGTSPANIADPATPATPATPAAPTSGLSAFLAKFPVYAVIGVGSLLGGFLIGSSV